jgi:hypothetical protein
VKTLLLILLVILAPAKKKDPPRTFQVVIVSEGVTRKGKTGEFPVSALARLGPNETVALGADGYCVLLDIRGNVFELAAGTRTLLDTLRGRARGISRLVDVPGLYSPNNLAPRIDDGPQCKYWVAFPSPFTISATYNADDMIPVLTSPESGLKFVVKNMFDEHIVDIEVQAPVFIDISKYPVLTHNDEYLMQMPNDCNYANMHVFRINKEKVRYHDVNLTNASPVLLIKALYFETWLRNNEATFLYKQAIENAPSNQVAVYENFFTLFKQRVTK